MKTRPVPYTLDATGQDVHSEGTRLREAGPASLVALPGDVVAWAVTSLSGLQELLTDPRVSKDPRQHWPRWINREITPEWPLFTWVAVQNMLTAYGADHKRLRSLSATAFTARNIATQRPRIEKITADLLDALAAHPGGEAVDLREGFAFPLPIEVISQLFGVPDTMRAMLRNVVDGLFDTSLSAEEAKANQAQLYPLLHEQGAWGSCLPAWCTARRRFASSVPKPEPGEAGPRRWQPTVATTHQHSLPEPAIDERNSAEWADRRPTRRAWLSEGHCCIKPKFLDHGQLKLPLTRAGSETDSFLLSTTATCGNWRHGR